MPGRSKRGCSVCGGVVGMCRCNPGRGVSGSNYNPAREGELAARRDNYEAARSEVDVAEEVRCIVQLLSVRALVYLRGLGSSARALVEPELASRGLDANGRWIGFEAARKMWGC